MDMLIFIILTITFLVLLIILVYRHSFRNYDYWKKKGIQFVKPKPFVGNFLDIFTSRTNIGVYMANLYNQYKNEPYIGLFSLQKPILVILSPELMKLILTTNFNSFSNRNYLYDPELDPLTTRFLHFLKELEWKQTRQKMTFGFTLAKLKNMVQRIHNVASEMTTYIEQMEKQEAIDTNTVTNKFATDVITAFVFAIKTNSFKNDNDDFNLIGRHLFHSSWKNAFAQNCYIIAPSIAKIFKLSFFDNIVRDITRNVFWKIFNIRNKASTSEHCLIDIINEIRSKEGDQECDKDRYLSQALAFYGPGSVEPASAFSYALYELCMNPEIQDKARKEINAFILEAELNYENLGQLKYLDMIIYETLRKYPVLPFIDRMSTNDFTIPNTSIVIEKGTPVFFPLLGIHRDGQYYQNPVVFDPERFKDNINKERFCYAPFGTGPRSCIGSKLAILELKIGLTRILTRFRLEKTPDTPEYVEFSGNSFLLAAKKELKIKFVNIS